jgi:hypothetical protein
MENAVAPTFNKERYDGPIRKAVFPMFAQNELRIIRAGTVVSVGGGLGVCSYHQLRFAVKEVTALDLDQQKKLI